VDSIVETGVLDFHFETRGEHIYTKQQLLANGERYESLIARDRALDAPYR
jgi:NADH-quinone oxidoreductase subunit I